MAANRFHLGWFLNFVPDAWNETWGDGGLPWDGEFYIEMARDLERACFDYVILEDKLMVSDAYGGTMEMDLKHGITPKHDPAPLATLLAYCTTRLGVVATLSSSFYPPFLLARDGNVYLRDLHARDSLALAEHPGKEVWLVSRAPVVGSPFRFEKVSIDSMFAEWRKE